MMKSGGHARVQLLDSDPLMDHQRHFYIIQSIITCSNQSENLYPLFYLLIYYQGLRMDLLGYLHLGRY